MEHLGAVLRDERARRLWTQDRVAEACGLTRQQLSRYESGAATPSWSTFRRVLAGLGVQPRIELEPLDADVAAAIARQRRRPCEEWLADVGLAAGLLHRLLAGLDWQATGVLALRLFGAPAPLTELEAEVALGDRAGSVWSTTRVGVGWRYGTPTTRSRVFRRARRTYDIRVRPDKASSGGSASTPC